jgi:C1A family cysteine protease
MALKDLRPRKIKRYGWIPDLPDHRDLLFAAPMQVLAKLPSNVDMRSQCPPVYDQGQLGSCTGNAIAGDVEFDLKKEKKQDFVPSRLFIYYNERVMEGTEDQDSGAYIRDGMKSVAKLGVCPENEWPYDISKFTEKPPQKCYDDATKTRAISYSRVARNVNQMKGCLASGYPFIIGFTVYESFESQEVARTGVVPMPASNEQVLGGHAVMVVGYDDSKSRFIIRNSWGDGWGMKGYFTMPYEYLLNADLSDDFWTIRMVS